MIASRIKPYRQPGLVLTCALAFILTASAVVAGTPYSRLYVFGDSLSDTGRFYADTGVPPAPYSLGRHCNGPLWIEQLASRLGMELRQENNYAYAGAGSGRDNENDNHFPQPQNFPGLLDQVDEFLSDTAITGVDPEALYVVWAGANDFVIMAETGGNPAQTIANGVANCARAVQTLAVAGARHILVVNVPDLGLTPLALATGNSAGFSLLVSIYNHNLELALDQMALAGCPTIRLKSDLVLQAMVAHAPDYGFTNVTQPFLLVGGNPDQFLFFDALHPTTGAHTVLAESAVASLLDYYSPRESRVENSGVVNALKGLVHASTRQ